MKRALRKCREIDIYVGKVFWAKKSAQLVIPVRSTFQNDLHPPIGGHHPVLYFTTHVKKKYCTAMCYVNICSILQFTCGSKREIICQLLPNLTVFYSTLLHHTQLHSTLFTSALNFSLENIANKAMQVRGHFIPNCFSCKKLNQR